MCEDFFDDNFEDNLLDPDNDFEEDNADDAGGEWYEDGEGMIAESEENNSSITPDNKSDQFDLADAMLLGMIGGAFYDATTGEKQQLKRIKPEDKSEK